MNKKATTFEFTSYEFKPEEGRVFFNYTTAFEGTDPLLFTETIQLPRDTRAKKIPQNLHNKLLESLHIILGISYYKLYCPEKIMIPYQLSKTEADFWNVVYKKGLGEFFYRNNLDPKISPTFPYQKNYQPGPISYLPNPKSLVGIGGGKDSIVVAELLKAGNLDFDTFFVSTNKASALIKNITRLIGKNHREIKRVLDSQVFQEHHYKGHIPVSAMYAFLGLFYAVLGGYKYIIVGNEYSSSVGNIEYKGITVNHQWSKSFEFEQLFQNYVKESITPDIVYFSLLRPFHEIRIVKLFSHYKKYFHHFSSCNSNFKIHPVKYREAVTSHDAKLFDRVNTKKKGLWCGQCAKCIFVFTLLSAYLSKKELVTMFGKNLYQNETLLPLFKDIMGFGLMKPFDCVGTFEEAQSAFFMAHKKFAGDFIMKSVSKATYHPEVFKTNKESNIPEKFKFLGMESALLLRYGQEGKATEQYLQKNYPHLTITKAVKEGGADYINKQDKFDIAVKTPGINKNLVTIPYVTPTNIFFSRAGNTIIGVTGSKGKSTTSTLIYEILKADGRNVEFLGNIGKPMLASLLKNNSLKPYTFYVLELSSFQLDDIRFSPSIAVLTSLFPEHMNFHGSLKKYFDAKKNIINFQDNNGAFIYNPQSKESQKWLKGYAGKAIPFDHSTPFTTRLLGEHNKENIRAAISVAKILGVAEKNILTTIEKFKGLPHRLELVGKYHGITFYDDAISTTPESTIMALKAIKNVDTIFLGGEDRGYNFSNLEKALTTYTIKNVVLFPDSGTKMITNQKGFNVLHTKKMSEAVKFAYHYTKEGSVCLLSCASPSYSLWKNFEVKGDQFKKFVKQLGKK